MTQEHYYIWFERSGGFAGISTQVEIDSRSLDTEEAEKVRKLIDQSGFFGIQKSDSSSAGLPDQYQYVITIERAGDKHTLELGESEVPDKLRPLIDYLTKKARTQRKH